MFDNLMRYYIDCFHRMGEPALVMLTKLVVPCQIIIFYYNKFPPIETLPKEEKIELWKYANELMPDADRQTKMNLIKVTLTIGSM